MWGVDSGSVTSRALRVRIARIADEYAHGFCDSILRGHGVDFLGVRPFEDGDSPRRVDWKASSRTDNDTELVVREFTPERKASVIVIADLGDAMRYPITKAHHAHALVEMFTRSAFVLGGTARIIGVLGDELLASGELTSSDDTILFMGQCDNPKLRRQFRQPYGSLQNLLAEWKLKNTLIVFVSDLRREDVLPIRALRVIDATRQNVESTYAVLGEWSGFTPSANIVTLKNVENGKAEHFDLRHGGEFHRESLKFADRVKQLKTVGRRTGMSVHVLPLTSDRPLAEFMRSWHKFQASRS